MGQKTKFNTPPESERFKKGESGNPSGSRGRSAETIPDAIQRKLSEPVTDPVKRRKRTNRRELAARRLVVQAVNGNARAISEVAKQRKLATRHAPKMRKISFEEAKKRMNGANLNETFYEKQAKEKAAFKRKAKEDASLADYVDRELRKRLMMDRDGTGKLVRMNMQEIIVHNLTNQYAQGDLAAIALVEKMSPKKSKSAPSTFTEVAKPSPKQAAEQETAERKERENARELFRELYPSENVDDDSVLDAKIREMRRK